MQKRSSPSSKYLSNSPRIFCVSAICRFNLSLSAWFAASSSACRRISAPAIVTAARYNTISDAASHWPVAEADLAAFPSLSCRKIQYVAPAAGSRKKNNSSAANRGSIPARRGRPRFWSPSVRCVVESPSCFVSATLIESTNSRSVDSLVPCRSVSNRLCGCGLYRRRHGFGRAPAAGTLRGTGRCGPERYPRPNCKEEFQCTRNCQNLRRSQTLTRTKHSRSPAFCRASSTDLLHHSRNREKSHSLLLLRRQHRRVVVIQIYFRLGPFSPLQREGKSLRSRLLRRDARVGHRFRGLQESGRLPSHGLAFLVHDAARVHPLLPLRLPSIVRRQKNLQNELPHRRSRRHVVPGSRVRQFHRHLHLLAFVLRRKLRLDRPVQLLRRMASRHFMKVYLVRAFLCSHRARVHDFAVHREHVAGLALLAFFLVRAVLPLRIRGQHRESRGVVIFVAGRANRRGNVHR